MGALRGGSVAEGAVVDTDDDPGVDAGTGVDTDVGADVGVGTGVGAEHADKMITNSAIRVTNR